MLSKAPQSGEPATALGKERDHMITQGASNIKKVER